MKRQLPGTITTGKPTVRHLVGTLNNGVPAVRHLPGTSFTPKPDASS